MVRWWNVSGAADELEGEFRLRCRSGLVLHLRTIETNGVWRCGFSGIHPSPSSIPVGVQAVFFNSFLLASILRIDDSSAGLATSKNQKDEPLRLWSVLPHQLVYTDSFGVTRQILRWQCDETLISQPSGSY